MPLSGVPDAESMQSGVWHLLAHLPPELVQRRLLSFGALSTGARAMLQALGWRYLQHIPTPSQLPYRIEFCRPNEPPMSLSELKPYVVPENMTRDQYVQFNGELAVNGEIPDWEEVVIANRTSMSPVDGISWSVTNGETGDEALDLVEIASSQSYLPGHLDLLGAGMYRGPSHPAVLRHLALVDLGIGFICERAARGCLWGLRREHAAARRFMHHFLRERAALGIELTPGERAHAKRILPRLDLGL